MITRQTFWIPHKLFQLYWRIFKPITRGVKAIVDDQNGSVLLVRHSYGQKSWVLPGGAVEKKESPATAIRRELREELDLITNEAELFGTYDNSQEGKQDTVYVYLVSGTMKFKISSSEILEARYFQKSELPDDISPATLRRLNEYERGAPSNGKW